MCYQYTGLFILQNWDFIPIKQLPSQAYPFFHLQLHWVYNYFRNYWCETPGLTPSVNASA